MFACAYLVASHPESDQHFATVLHAAQWKGDTWDPAALDLLLWCEQLLLKIPHIFPHPRIEKFAWQKKKKCTRKISVESFNTGADKLLRIHCLDCDLLQCYPDVLGLRLPSAWPSSSTHWISHSSHGSAHKSQPLLSSCGLHLQQEPIAPNCGSQIVPPPQLQLAEFFSYWFISSLWWYMWRPIGKTRGRP